MNHWSLPDLCFLWVHFYFMNYKRIYDQICSRGKLESENRIKQRRLWITSKGSKGVYYESHHILPLCLGGTGKAFQWNHENIALLTAREHFLCHWLLYRQNPDNRSLLYAFDKMCVISPTQSNNRYIPSSRVINEILESKRRLGRGDDFKQLMSKKFRGKERARLTCPHCGKIGGQGNMQRWHFNNCLNKPGNETIIRKPAYIGPRKPFSGIHSEKALLAYKNLSEVKKKRILNCETNEIYESITDCLRLLNIKHKEFYKRIDNKSLKKINK